MNIFEKQTLAWGAIGFIAFTFIANSVKADTQVQDHYKNVIHKIPSNVEVCYDRQVSGDKTGDTIMGAIIGIKTLMLRKNNSLPNLSTKI